MAEPRPGGEARPSGVHRASGAGSRRCSSRFARHGGPTGPTVAVLPSTRPRSARAAAARRSVRIEADPADRGCSSAARWRAGEVVAAWRPPRDGRRARAAAAFDVVVVETVGVGHRRVAEAPTRSPSSQHGRAPALLQFLKAGSGGAGRAVVTSDLGGGEGRPRSRRRRCGRWATRRAVLAVSAASPSCAGIDDLMRALESNRARLDLPAARPRARLGSSPTSSRRTASAGCARSAVATRAGHASSPAPSRAPAGVLPSAARRATST